MVDQHEDIVKHAKAAFVDGESVDGFAFLPRDGVRDTDGSSVNRLRVFSDDDEAAMVNVREVFRLEVRKSHRFAQVNVEKLVAVLALHADLNVRVIPDPLPANDTFREDPSHALIAGLPSNGLADELLGDLIGQIISKVHPAIAQ